jgi:Na+/proline symporter
MCKRYLQEVQTSEMYMTAQRTVKTGLVASAIVSSWSVTFFFLLRYQLLK